MLLLILYWIYIELVHLLSKCIYVHCMCKKRTIYMLASCYLRYSVSSRVVWMGVWSFASFCEICTLVYNVEVGNTPAEERVHKAKGGNTHCLKHGNTHKDAHTYVRTSPWQPTYTHEQSTKPHELHYRHTWTAIVRPSSTQCQRTCRAHTATD